MEDYEDNVTQDDGLDEDFDAEDALPEEIVEEDQDDSQDLEEMLAEDEQPEPEQAGTPEPNEPGYVQRRISKAVQKATASLQNELAALRAQMEPLREYQLNMEAQDLVRSGKVKDMETAMELVRYRQGQPPEQADEQPRNERGQFESRDSGPDPAVQTRIDMLQHQADRILDASGVDVIGEFRNNEEIRELVVSGEMDFYDVAEMLANQTPQRRPPSPMRSPNGASGTNPNAIDLMSDEQFERMERKIKEGARYTLR